ncbi:MAG: SDR family oxidoreductase [Corallococcus sp.]|nr:SDR family oxidoreductase [Corallococcus sp.]MCM1359216.1 SDR family oxidoreductase [Corallococcus sp.]MCM1394606.1 SDR family oxidoreductase [Corallococcus sp.]
MKILITGTSHGIGKAVAHKFLSEGHSVYGIDVCTATIDHPKYLHYSADIFSDTLPEINGIQILVNNAGVQNSGRDIDVNLKGAMRVTEKYAFQDEIKSVLFIASASAHTGSEFPEYAASKGGMIAYMKNVALRVAKWQATSNSLSPGGVLTNSNKRVIDDPKLWKRIMDQTLIPKWAEVSEIADWAYFVTFVNRSMTAQDILIDNGEIAKAEFVW